MFLALNRPSLKCFPPVVDLVSNLGPLVLSIETALDSLVIGLDGVVPGSLRHLEDSVSALPLQHQRNE